MKSILYVLIIVFVQTVFGQNKTQKIDSLFTSLYNSNKFNGNILIAEKDSIIFTKSFGYANESTKEKLNENTIFELASCTKPFTAMAILILKDQGKLNLDDKISKYIPELYKYNNITIRNLMNHTGGIPDYMALMDTIWDKSKIATNKDIIKILEKQQPNELFEPNTKEEYSNTGYALLATIIEKTSGKTYAEFLESAIFKPLKMTRTFVYHRRFSGKKIKNYAVGYLYLNGDYILPDDYERSKFVFWLDGVEGDGTVNSTINDLYKWNRALKNNKLLSKESLKLINSNGILSDGTLAHHGYGWRVLDTEPFGKIARHSGAWPGYLTYIERDLDTDKTIIILQNHYNGAMPKQAVQNILYGMPIPKTMEILYREGKTVDEIIAWLKNPVSKYLIDDFYEDGVNKFGYELLKQGKNESAVKIFEYNTNANPKSSNAFDSLGECLLKMNYKEQAKKAYEKSLELDPTNKNAESIISNLKRE
ncbi:serine hydrolase [Flavobacterium rhizosphaerae]|uniref:Serine hydrolase n=1 Tax=Flavobacterium rhizosphaerae TaxID=3163298 RepID=A0ABW8Z1J8_9FLAO